MGPPPDPESMIALMENPQFASTMNEALQNPQIIDQMIQSNPLLRGMGPQVREAMQDPNFRRMMTDPAMMRQMAQMSRRVGFGGGGFGGRGGGEAFPAPGVTDTTPIPEGEGTQPPPSAPLSPFGLLGNMGGAGGPGGLDGLAALLQGIGSANPTSPGPTNTTTSPPGQGNAASGPTQGAANNPFANLAQNPLLQNPAVMQQLLGAMGGGSGNDAGGTGNAFNPLAALFGPDGLAAQQPAAPPDNRPPEERYEAQLRQLNDMGFYEFERNIEALRRSGGSVQGAVEYLLTHWYRVTFCQSVC